MNRRSLLAASAAIAGSGALAATFERLFPELTPEEIWVLWLATTPYTTEDAVEDAAPWMPVILKLEERGLMYLNVEYNIHTASLEGKAALKRAGYERS
jgi:hypothetical protein